MSNSPLTKDRLIEIETFAKLGLSTASENILDLVREVHALRELFRCPLYVWKEPGGLVELHPSDYADYLQKSHRELREKIEKLEKVAAGARNVVDTMLRHDVIGHAYNLRDLLNDAGWACEGGYRR